MPGPEEEIRFDSQTLKSWDIDDSCHATRSTTYDASVFCSKVFYGVRTFTGPSRVGVLAFTVAPPYIHSTFRKHFLPSLLHFDSA